MSYVDIVIIALLVLFALFGVWKGVQKSALSLGAFLVAFAIAFFLSNVVAEALLNIDGIRNFVMGSSGDGFSLYMFIHEVVGKGMPSDFLLENYFSPIVKVIVEYTEKYSLTALTFDAYSLYISFMLFSAIVGVGLFIVARALLCIVTMIVKSYIPRKKSLGNRVCGFAVGAVRGAAWAFAVTILFSIVAGLPFVGFTKVEEEYEKGMLGQYVNQYSYVMRNKFFLPDVDMFARIVNKSGLAASEEPETDDPLASDKADVKVEFLNLNYLDGAFQKNDDNTISYNEASVKISASDFVDVGFDSALSAVISYNDAISARLTATTDNILDGANAATLSALLVSGQNINAKMYLADPDVDEEVSSLFTALRNYATEWDSVKDIDFTDQNVVDETNALLEKYYDAVTDYFDQIEQLYNNISLFTDDSDIGLLTVPGAPQLKQVELSEEEDDGGEEVALDREPVSYRPRFAFAA